MHFEVESIARKWSWTLKKSLGTHYRQQKKSTILARRNLEDERDSCRVICSNGFVRRNHFHGSALELFAIQKTSLPFIFIISTRRPPAALRTHPGPLPNGRRAR